MKSILIRPGLLVSLKTTIRGGVSYDKREIEPEHLIDGTATVATWETTRRVQDAAELERATVARGKARTAITRACIPSSFGLLCPVANEDKLAEGIAEAQDIADAHRRTAFCTRLDVYVITGRIADNDEQAMRAVGSEIRDLIGAMESAVRAASPDAIRDAANRARALNGMLGEETQKKVSAAISEARKVARDIVSRVDKAGERAADVVEGLKLEALAGARFAVLDMLGENEMPAETEAMPVAGRAVDFELARDYKPLDHDATPSNPNDAPQPLPDLDAANAEATVAAEVAVAIEHRKPRQFDGQARVHSVDREGDGDAAPGFARGKSAGDLAIFRTRINEPTMVCGLDTIVLGNKPGWLEEVTLCLPEDVAVFTPEPGRKIVVAPPTWMP